MTEKMASFERIVDSLIPLIVISAFVLPWLAIVPLFWITPPSEPEGDYSCRHWQECVEERNRRITLSGQNQESDKNGTTTE